MNKLISFFLANIRSRRHILNQAAIMAGARILAMLFGAVGLVWAARCLGPKNLGISGMVLNIVAQASLLFGVIHQTVLVREYKNAANNEMRNELVQLSMSYRIIGAVIIAIIGAVTMSLGWFPPEYHFAGWFFIPLVVLMTAQPIWVFQAAEKQHFQSMIAVLQPTLASILYLSIFKPGMSAGADLAVYTCVAVVLAFVYWFAIYRLTPFRGSPISFYGVKKAILLVWQSRWFFYSSIAIYVYTTLEQPLLGWLNTLDELGKYRTAMTIVGAAQGIFVIVPMLLYPRFIEWRKRDEELLWNRQIKLASLFVFIGIIGAVCGFIVMPYIHPFLFGVKFAEAAIPCAILITSKLIVIPSGVFAWGLMTDPTYDKRVSLSMIGMAIVSVVCNVMFIPKYGMYATSTLNAISEGILFIAFVYLSWARIKLIRSKKKRLHIALREEVDGVI